MTENLFIIFIVIGAIMFIVGNILHFGISKQEKYHQVKVNDKSTIIRIKLGWILQIGGIFIVMIFVIINNL